MCGVKVWVSSSADRWGSLGKGNKCWSRHAIRFCRTGAAGGTYPMRQRSAMGWWCRCGHRRYVPFPMSRNSAAISSRSMVSASPPGFLLSRTAVFPGTEASSTQFPPVSVLRRALHPVSEFTSIFPSPFPAPGGGDRRVRPGSWHRDRRAGLLGLVRRRTRPHRHRDLPWLRPVRRALERQIPGGSVLGVVEPGEPASRGGGHAEALRARPARLDPRPVG